MHRYIGNFMPMLSFFQGLFGVLVFKTPFSSSLPAGSLAAWVILTHCSLPDGLLAAWVLSPHGSVATFWGEGVFGAL